jgi:hypothetical protein
MRNLLYAFLVLISFSPVYAGQNFPKSICEIKTDANVNEWVEYVQIGDQWYKITHLDDGSEIAVPVAGPIKD